MTSVELRPPMPFPVTRFERARFDADVEEWAWAMRLEEELDYDLFARDVAAARRQRMVGRVRLVAFVTIVCSVAAVVRVGVDYGLGLGLVGACVDSLMMVGAFGATGSASGS